MRNRYGETYDFELIAENTYKFVGDTKWCRMGGKPDAPDIDRSDLGFFDPSGGPFIAEGFIINGKSVKRIFVNNNQVCFEVS